jgi:nicotinamidase-related amidase
MTARSYHEEETIMTVTVLDPKTALIVIDLQKGILSYPMAHPLHAVSARAAALADAFRGRGLPVVLVRVAGIAPGRTEQPRGGGERPAGWMDLLPELNQQPQDHIVTKRTPGAFTHTDLEAYLRSRDVTQVVIVGVSTSNGVAATAQHAYELGFNVTLAIDAMTDVRSDSHDYSITQVFPRLGETGTTHDIINLLDRSAA